MLHQRNDSVRHLRSRAYSSFACSYSYMFHVFLFYASVVVFDTDVDADVLFVNLLAGRITTWVCEAGTREAKPLRKGGAGSKNGVRVSSGGNATQWAVPSRSSVTRTGAFIAVREFRRQPATMG